MFAYTDPAGNVLKPLKALNNYRQLLHDQYRRYARLPASAFTLLEAFQELPADATPDTPSVTWIAFPRTSGGTNDQIDRNRFTSQDEYVEWRVERNAAGAVTRITFTTEFPEYWEAIAMAGLDALIAAIRGIRAGAPKAAELFGPGFNPNTATPESRAARFRGFARRNPWNNGQKEILFLTQPNNTLGALFDLVGNCAVPKAGLPADGVCGSPGVACVPDRNSDPAVCQAAQTLARGKNGISLQDPAGIRILELSGIWRLNGKQIDINDSASNKGIWAITRGGSRAVLRVAKGLTIGADPIAFGAQVARLLKVGATVIAASETSLPEWSRMGQESSRVLAEKIAAAGDRV